MPEATCNRATRERVRGVSRHVSWHRALFLSACECVTDLAPRGGSCACAAVCGFMAGLESRDGDTGKRDEGTAEAATAVAAAAGETAEADEEAEAADAALPSAAAVTCNRLNCDSAAAVSCCSGGCSC